MKYNFLAFYLLLSFITFSQEIKKDSIKTNKLDEVVITAQYSKQSVNKSIYDVTVISAKEIQQNASNNLADLLNQNLNILIVPSASTGKSAVSLFGLDGQYFKILQDGIPMVSDEGFGNNIDLTQINLDNIKQIEIVEGSMGVEYGANAVSGIINLITKKSSYNNLEFSASMQEETVGNEYELWQQGRHIQNAKISKNINDDFYTSLNFSRNHFTGFLNNKKGKNFIESNGLRGYEWLPKEQLSGNAIFNYKKDNFNANYNLGVFKELLNFYNDVIISYYDTELGQNEKIANDVDYKTVRLSHNLIFNGKINNQINYTFSNAYQTQNRKKRNYIYNLYDRYSIKEGYKNYLNRKSFFSKATFSNFIKHKTYNFQLGAEYNNEKGFGSSEASFTSSIDVNETISNFDVFGSSEIFIGKKLSFRPGLRYSFQSKFNNQLSYSLSSKYQFTNNIEFRNVISSSFRTPNYDELFTFFIHPSHNVFGNEDLKSENSFSVITHFMKKNRFKNNLSLTNKLKIGFINVKDKIELVLVETSPKLLYNYINIDQHKSVNFTSENSLKFKSLKFKLGATIQGISQILKSEINANNDFLYSYQINTNLAYKINKINTSFALNYKYNSKQNQYIQVTDQNNNSVFVKATRAPFSWLDASLKKTFYNQKITSTLGVRNLLNVTENKTSTQLGGTLHGGSNTVLLGYGRSYFLKLNYNFSI